MITMCSGARFGSPAYPLRSVCLFSGRALHVNRSLCHICRCLFSCLLTATGSQTVQQGIDSEMPLWSPHVPPLWTLSGSVCLHLLFPRNGGSLALSSRRYIKPASPFSRLLLAALTVEHTQARAGVSAWEPRAGPILVLTGSVVPNVFPHSASTRRLTARWHLCVSFFLMDLNSVWHLCVCVFSGCLFFSFFFPLSLCLRDPRSAFAATHRAVLNWIVAFLFHLPSLWRLLYRAPI